jgi:hypothetical protein
MQHIQPATSETARQHNQHTQLQMHVPSHMHNQHFLHVLLLAVQVAGLTVPSPMPKVLA